MLISKNWAICAIKFTDNIINTILYILYYKLCDSETIPLLLYKHITWFVSDLTAKRLQGKPRFF